ncbi:MAG TPA: LysM peptidoglycan-binding domain-containing protein [Desulfobulbus sp.]|nr:LysM peptidoglycan-binding domain-containing protein [Desulfobulbus sp.]
MVNPPDSSRTLAAAELVQARIDEKRLFEARFLFHKLSSTIEPRVSLLLEQSLEEKIAQAEKFFNHGQRMEEQQRYGEAENDYGRALAIAVDYPSVDRALQRIVVLRKLGPLQAPSSSDDSGNAPEQTATVAIAGAEVPGRQGRRRRRKILVLVLSLLFIFAGSAAILLIGRGFSGSGSPEAPSEKSVTSGSTSPIPPATNGPAALPETLHGQKEQVEKMTGIVLPRAIAPPIINDAPAPSTTAGSVVKNTKNTPETQLPAEPPAVEEQPVIRAVVPVQGQVVKVPAGNNGFLAVDERSEKSKKPAAKKKKETGTAATGRDEQPSAGAIKTRIYTVQAGDTLEAIAGKVYGDRSQWSSLVQANREQLGRSPYILTVGEKLVVPPREQAARMQSISPVAANDTYTVVSGDSLGVIAQKVYGSSRRWQRLYELNRDRLSSPSALRVGQQLRIRKEPDASVDSDPVGE